MQLIGAGLPRTATTTQKVALETLGLGPCYHMRDMMADLDKGVRLWRSAYDGEAPWHEVFGDARSTVDWPSAFHWRELMDAYPDAKVLLSVRDHESWARSMRDTICQIYFGDSLLHHLAQARYHVDPAWKGWVDLMVDTFWTGRGPLDGTNGDSARMIDKAERWNQEVKDSVPGERLLVWEPKDGWEPLCEFIGVEVPAEELPPVNADHYIVRFYRAFAPALCEPSHLSLFRREQAPEDVREHLLAHDLICVGGGSVISLLGTCCSSVKSGQH